MSTTPQIPQQIGQFWINTDTYPNGSSYHQVVRNGHNIGTCVWRERDGFVLVGCRKGHPTLEAAIKQMVQRNLKDAREQIARLEGDAQAVMELAITAATKAITTKS